MKLDLAYQGRSRIEPQAGGAQSLRFAANLRREAVSFDGALKRPLRFREAISALHDVVINDLRFKPRDREAYEAWKRAEAIREEKIRREEFTRLKQQVLENHPKLDPNLERKYDLARRRYWKLRTNFSTRLMTRNPELWRLLMPADPVVTIADDVVFFECFSADQSSYGCLTLDRDDAFGRSSDLQLGTTNVDYSWSLYDHFQTLRSYRETRLKVDPEGFEATTTGGGEHREEKIDLPEGWLRGFMQVQSGMTLPMRRVTLSRAAIYSILAWHRRNKARKSPRAMRFELTPGQTPVVVLEPWEQKIDSKGTTYDGLPTEPIRIWGARRVLTLARLLPLMESCDVYLLGTGLPSFWVARMGEMRLTLGLSGWTVNDWSGGSALTTLLPPGSMKQPVLQSAINLLQRDRSLSFDSVRSRLGVSAGDCAATLNELAYSGQVIHDLDAGVYRWRQVMPMPLGETELGSDSPELSASKQIVMRGNVSIANRQAGPQQTEIISGRVDQSDVSMLLDRDGVIKRGECDCQHHRRAGIRRGPCRHLLALRIVALGQTASEDRSTTEWYERLLQLSSN